ncbi:MAG: prepilin-type N-terminal cleavage/methylation domain-containing protein [Phycisphaerales bacterium]|jgi:MSHA pilin protein MshD|nr:prepilin-type N-terminal cleavage/methylation domain-containing protein [Phycisphaerales bacterium]
MRRTDRIQTRRRGGFTLIEALLAAVVLSVAVGGVAMTMSAAHGQSAMLRENTKMVMLGRQLMEEITALPFADPDTGQAKLGPNEMQRSGYDDVGDYNNYSDSSDDLTTAGGEPAAMTDTGAYQRDVKVEFRSQPQGPADSDGKLALITVTITAPSGRTLKLSRLVARTTNDNYP